MNRSPQQGTVTSRLSERGADRISINTFQVKAEVSPGASVPWSFVIQNNADVNVFDDDWCEQLFPPASGVRMYIQVEFAGKDDIREGVCVPDEGGSQEITGEFIAPTQPGDYDVSVSIEGNNTGRQIAQQTRTVTVVSEQDEPVGDCPAGFQLDPQTGNCVPVDDGDGGDGGFFPPGDDGGNGGGGPLLGGLLGGGNQLVLLAFLLVLLFILVRASGE